MKNKGFTFIELLAIIILLGVVSLIVYPIIIEVVEKKNNEIDKATLDIFYSAADEYIKNNPNSYPQNIGDTYCFTIKEIDSENLIPIDIKKYENKGIQVKIGEKNSYSVVDRCGDPISIVTKNLLDNNTEYGNYAYMGGSYLKGVQNNNYVWYNGFMWRIMGKNQDGTIRLITEENVTAIPWGASGAGLSPAYNEKVGYINDWLNDYFYSHLNDTKSIIEDSTWCINTTTTTESVRTDCAGGTTFNSKVGLISIDEYNLSGASQTNNTYYLVNGQYYWTIAPYNVSNAWYVYNNGYAYYNDVPSTIGVRPVINVKADATITVGDGTATNPYMLEQANTNVANKTLNEKTTSGEYVKLSDKTYRVVSKEDPGIKLILDGYYEQDSTFGTNNTFAGSTIDTLLNGNVLDWLNSDKIIDTSWNQGGVFDRGNPYTTSLTNSGNNITRKVGLIRIGELLSGQSSTILTNNYTVASSDSNANYYWTMTPYISASYAWEVGYSGYAYRYDVTNSIGIRPVIYVSGSNIITKGNGTPSSPYEI